MASVLAGAEAMPALERTGEMRRVLEADTERDVGDGAAGLPRVGEQPAGLLETPFQDPVRRRCSFRLEQQIEVADGYPERLGDVRW
jgi:hypothetical protein